MQINFENFDKLTMGDVEFAQDLLHIYIKELEEYIKEIDEFLKSKDLPKFRLRNHDIRTVVRTLSMDSVIDMQEKLKSAVTRNLPNEELHRQGDEIKKFISEAVKALKGKLG